MLSIFALSVVGSWTYAGFLSEPGPDSSPAPTPPEETVPAISAPAEPGPAEEPEPDAANVAPESIPEAPRRPEAPPASPPPRTTLYRATDALGQSWDHPDPAYLARFVEARNRSFATFAPAPPPSARQSSACVTGRCN